MAAIKGSHPAQRRYPPEIKERGVRVVHELRRAGETRRDRLRRPAWHHHDREPGDRRAAQGGQRAPVGERGLDRRVQFLRGGTRPSTYEVITFIDSHGDNESGACRWAPSRSRSSRGRPLHRLSGEDAPALGPAHLADEAPNVEIAHIHDEPHHGVYGIEKVWWQAQREGIDVGRDRVARLMRELGLFGAVRWHKTRTMTPDSEKKGPKIWSSATSAPLLPTALGRRRDVRLDMGRLRLHRLHH